MKRNAQRTPRGERENSAGFAAVADAPEEEQRKGQAGSQGKEEKQAPPPDKTFWEFLAALGDRWQTEGLALYCYRLWPITDTRNPERFLCKLSEGIDEDYLLKNFGSGKYWLVLNNAQGKHIRKHVSNPHHPDFPPRVAPQEVIESNPQNKLFFEVWARKDGHPAATQRMESNAAEPANGGDGAVKELAGLLKLTLGDRRKDQTDEVTKTLIDWALAQKDKERAENSPTAVASLVKELKSLMPTPIQPAATDPLAIVEKVLSIQNRGGTDLKTLWEIVQDAQGRREEPRDPLQNAKETVELFTQVRDLFGSGSVAGTAPNSRGDGDSLSWQRMLVELSANVAPTLNALGGFIGMLKGNPSAPSPAGAAPRTPPVPTSFDPYRDAGRMREFARAQNTAAGTPPTSKTADATSSVPPTSGMGDQTTASAGPIANGGASTDDGAAAQLAALVSTALGCLNRGVNGHECAEGFILLNGELQFQTMVNQIKGFGPPVIVQLAKGLPQVGPQVSAYEEQLTRFLDELIEGPRWEEDGAAA